MEKNPLALTSYAEIAHINEMQEDLNRKLIESHRKDLGRMDSLRSSILSLVVSENYDRARDEMVAYVELKTAFPGFQERVQRLVQHCSELVQAIQTKRNFPGLSALSLAKQQEIHEKVIEHFEDLKQHLRQIEKIEREHKLDDVRSTVWVVRAFCQAVGIVVAVALFLDVKNGMFGTAMSVTDSLVESAAHWIVNLIHL